MSPRTAMTLTMANLREGADANSQVLAVLQPQTQLVVLQEDEEWCQVSVAEQEGYLLRAFIVFAEESVSAGFLRMTLAESSVGGGLAGAETADASAPSGQGFTGAEAMSASLAPPAFLQISMNSQLTAAQKQVAKAWNRVGGLLGKLATELKFEPGVALAVLAIEAGGRAFAADGRMIIRFEVHVFFDKWGEQNQPRFNRHFRFNQEEHWKGHEWRLDVDRPWQKFHDKQDTEWEVFKFARTLNEKAAMLSISMGGPQIMGFNYPNIGYESVQQMFEAFRSSERAQIIGFFDFVKRGNPNSERILALQKRDFLTFATLYNGKSRAVIYADQMRASFETFQQLWKPLSVRHVNTAALNLRRTPESGGNIIRALPQDTRVTLFVEEPIRAEEVVWVKVRADQDVGYVSGAFLRPRVS